MSTPIEYYEIYTKCIKLHILSWRTLQKIYTHTWLKCRNEDKNTTTTTTTLKNSNNNIYHGNIVARQENRSERKVYIIIYLNKKKKSIIKQDKVYRGRKREKENRTRSSATSANDIARMKNM